MRKLLVLCAFAAGCDLYWGGGGGDDVCATNGGAYGGDNLRDPSTGTCSYYGGGSPPCCSGTTCVTEKTPTRPDPDWATCDGRCEALGEQDCLVASGCRAAYLDNNDALTPVFWGCWETAPSGPVEGGGCVGLDAYTCSRHDDCGAVYGGTDRTNFERCIAEPGTLCTTDTDCNGDQRCDTSVCHMAPCPDCPECGACAQVCYGVCVAKDSCSATTCAPGTHCEQECPPCSGPGCTAVCNPMCVPDQDCTTVDCGPGYQCVEQCNALVGPCQVQCVPVDHDPGQCYGSVTCTSPPPLCPASTTPGVANGCYTGYCIPIAACMPNDPGQCYATVTCTAAPPQCPSGTLPGVTNGCYTGFCIPTYDCELAACETLTTEAACTGRGDCEPIYVGTDCTCDPDHCECQTLTYERCQSQVMPL